MATSRRRDPPAAKAALRRKTPRISPTKATLGACSQSVETRAAAS